MKKTVSLIMLYSMLAMTYTGIMLFVAPEGKVAYWVNWSMLGMSKTQFGNMHVSFMILFVLATIFHIYFNFRLMVSYMKDKVKKFVFFTKENLIALGITFAFIFGTLYITPPFSNLFSFEKDIKHYWADTLGKPPYGHAELSSLKTFCKRTGYDLDEAILALEKNGIKVNSSKDNLKKIADANNITPAQVYDVIFEELF
jgi:hypothetical protein